MEPPSPAIWDHPVLPATQQRQMYPTLTPARQAGNYLRGMEGWVDFGVRL